MTKRAVLATLVTLNIMVIALIVVVLHTALFAILPTIATLAPLAIHLIVVGSVWLVMWPTAKLAILLTIVLHASQVILFSLIPVIRVGLINVHNV